MTTPRGTVVFLATSEPRGSFEWPVEVFLLAAHEAKTWEQFKLKLMGTAGKVHFARRSQAENARALAKSAGTSAGK